MSTTAAHVHPGARHAITDLFAEEVDGSTIEILVDGLAEDLHGGNAIVDQPT